MACVCIMTVSYAQFTHTSAKIGVFLRVLRIWRGGVLKGVWRELLIFISVYAIISLIYRFVLSLDELSKENFETFCVYCAKYSHRIPLSFILGFYVSQVVSRWWDQWKVIAWPDRLALELNANLACRNKKRCIVRWACLSNVIILRMISSKVALRFPTMEHLVEAGLLTPQELKKLDLVIEKTEGRHDLAWYPIQWSIDVVMKAWKNGEIPADRFASNLQQTLLAMAANNWQLYCYGWISIPLVYTQLVTIAVYAYFLATLFGRQFIKPTLYTVEGFQYIKAEDQNLPIGTPNIYNKIGLQDGTAMDMYLPLFTILEFVFYFGWLKVAESLINPFGEDDDDFDTNYIIDRNLQLAYLMVEREETEVEDPWREQELPPAILPHTLSSAEYKYEGPKMPTDDFVVNEDDLVLESDGENAGFSRKSSIKEQISVIGREMSIRSRRQPLVKFTVSNRGRLRQLGLAERPRRNASSIYSGACVLGRSKSKEPIKEPMKRSHKSRMGNGGDKLEVVLEVMEVREVDILDKTSQLNYDVEKVNEVLDPAYGDSSSERGLS